MICELLFATVFMTGNWQSNRTDFISEAYFKNENDEYSE